MTSKSWAALSLVVAAALVSCCSASSHVRSQGIALPESRVTTRPIHQRQTKTVDEVLSPTSDSVEKATTSFRGGASALPAKAIYGVIVMALIEAVLKKFFALTNIQFPSQLGGCMFLFVVAVVAQMIHPGWGDSIQAFLEPGCALMNKWLPSFFVPGLAMLPLAPSIGSGKEVSCELAIVTTLPCCVTAYFLKSLFSNSTSGISDRQGVRCGCLGPFILSFHNLILCFGFAQSARCDQRSTCGESSADTSKETAKTQHQSSSTTSIATKAIL